MTAAQQMTLYTSKQNLPFDTLMKVNLKVQSIALDPNLTN